MTGGSRMQRLRLLHEGAPWGLDGRGAGVNQEAADKPDANAHRRWYGGACARFQ